MKVKSELVKKWSKLLENPELPKIRDSFRKGVVAQLLENQEDAMRSGQAGMNAQTLLEAGEVANNTSADFGAPNSNNTTNISGVDPVMISLVRRAMPNLVAYDLCGVQPMSGPSGLVFALRSVYGKDSDLKDNAEAFYNEADSDFTGTGTHAGNSPAVLNDASAGTYTKGTGKATLDGELLGSDGNPVWPEMGFTIEKVSVNAKTRALKAGYTVELAQDLKAIHGLDAETELANILSTEMLAEINREVLRTVYITAVKGAQNNDLTTAGVFDLDTDSNGRWAVEKFKGLLFQIERDCNRIALDTRRGKGNFIVCTSDVASALSLAGVLDYAPALQAATSLDIDDTGNTFAGVLNGKTKVYIDPYAIPNTPTAQSDAGHNFYVAGYKGPNAWDAGIYYAPYVPLQMFRAVDTNTFQPKIGYKTRYGIVANPFAQGTTKGLGALTANTNLYFRRVKVTNLAGTAI